MSKNTKRRIEIFVGIIVVLLGFSSSIGLMTAKETQQSSVIMPEGDPSITQQTGTQQSVPDNRVIRRTQFLEAVREQIKTSQRDYLDISRNVSDVDTRLTDTQIKITSLSEQLKALDEQIIRSEEMIINVKKQITEKENQLLLIYDDMEMKNLALNEQKEMLAEYLKTLYEQESAFTNTINDNAEINVSKMLLSDLPVGDQLQGVKYFGVLEATGHEIIGRIEATIADLQTDEIKIKKQKSKLSELYTQLEEEMNNLSVQRDAKTNLLKQTKGEEKIYSQLLEQSKLEQEQSLSDLNTLRSNLQFIQKKMDELGDQFNPDDYAGMFSSETTSVYNYIRATSQETGDLAFQWPVSPSRGVSAYFHDQSYKRAFGVGHNAIDIRVPQGTIIRAPADGVVYKVKDNGYGYSYLILAHRGGFMTTYGHVSEFMVSAGDRVFRGQPIGRSGGTPGTEGAGLMTTGAHLHFEIMLGGKYVDPLDYMPLTLLPFDSLPDKYRTRITGDKGKVSRSAAEEVFVQMDSPEEVLPQIAPSSQ